MIYNEQTINTIRDILLIRNETIAAAESATAGHLQAALSVGLEASKYFQGGITTYNLGQKVRHLGLDPITCENCNCVDIAIANSMAIEIGKMFSSHYGIAITGYASIVPQCEEEGLFAFYSISYNNEIVSSGKITCDNIEPFAVQVSYANSILKKLLNHLSKESLTSEAELVL